MENSLKVNLKGNLSNHPTPDVESPQCNTTHHSYSMSRCNYTGRDLISGDFLLADAVMPCADWLQ